MCVGWYTLLYCRRYIYCVIYLFHCLQVIEHIPFSQEYIQVGAATLIVDTSIIIKMVKKKPPSLSDPVSRNLNYHIIIMFECQKHIFQKHINRNVEKSALIFIHRGAGIFVRLLCIADIVSLLFYVILIACLMYVKT